MSITKFMSKLKHPTDTDVNYIINAGYFVVSNLKNIDHHPLDESIKLIVYTREYKINSFIL
jgi:hypothetical protein